jgi:exopolysaccharide biosynthesis polyprenyl glycosylphosphotransferase
MNGTAARRSPEPPALSAAAIYEPAAAFAAHDFPAFPARAKSAHRARQFIHRSALATLDFVLVCVGGVGAYWLRFGVSNIHPSKGLSWPEFSQVFGSPTYPAFLLLYAAIVVLSCISLDVYCDSREQSAWQEALRPIRAVAFASGLLLLFIFVSGNKEISRLVAGGTAAWSVAALTCWRCARWMYGLQRVRSGEDVSRVLIVGAGKVGRALAAWFDANWQLGYRVCGFLDPQPSADSRILGSVRDLRTVALGHFADHLFVTQPADREMVKELFVEARRLRLNLHMVPDLYDGLAWRAPVSSLGGFPVIELHGEPIPEFGLALKRVMDLLGSLAVLAVTSPLLALAAVWIRCDSPGPVFYSALRVGKKGRKFRCYKLRTMVVAADAQKDQLRQTNDRHGPFFKMHDDPRVTRCGRWLRKYSIDELPQLINVLFGDMSLVGPRPHPLDDFERYRVEHLRRLDVKPGVTGLWQVTARCDPSFDTNMALDLEYIENWSLRSDLSILLRTISVVLEGRGQ